MPILRAQRDHPEQPLTIARLTVAILTATAVWIPYFTLGLPFRASLVTQAAGLLILFAGAALLGWWRGPRPSLVPVAVRRWRQELHPGQSAVLLGLVLYALAAVLGAGTALIRGNSPSLLAGQLLAMGLLPLGALAGFALGPLRSWPSFQGALTGAAAAAALLHFAHWVRMALQGEVLRRLVLRHSVAITGICLLAVGLALAGARAESSRRRLAYRVALVLLVVFVIGSGTRGLWLVTPAVVLATLVLAGRQRGTSAPASARWRWVQRLCFLAAALLVAIAGWRAHIWLEEPRPNLLRGLGSEILRAEVGISPPEVPFFSPGMAGASGGQGDGLLPLAWMLEEPAERDPEWRERFRQLPPPSSYEFPPIPLPEAAPREATGGAGRDPRGRGAGSDATVRIRFEARAHDEASGGDALIILRWLDGGGRVVERVGARISPHPFWQHREIIWVAPRGAAAVELTLSGEKEATGTWELRSASLERLGPARLRPLLAQLAYFDHRLGTLLHYLPGRREEAVRAATADSSLSVRLGETREILRRYRQAQAVNKIFGHGLGATFTLAEEIPSAARNEETGEQNYLHNFYLFLLFKLGLAGGLLVCAALGLWLLGTVRLALALPPGPARSFLAATAAAWLGYAVLSLSSPEILNFRVAPLLGLGLAMAVGAAATSLEPAREGEG